MGKNQESLLLGELWGEKTGKRGILGKNKKKIENNTPNARRQSEPDLT